MNKEIVDMIEAEIDKLGWHFQDAPIEYNNEEASAWNSGRNVGYIAGRSKSIEIENVLRQIVDYWIGEEPFKDEPTFKTHNDGVVGEFGYWTPSAKRVKAELIYKAKQLLK